MENEGSNKTAEYYLNLAKEKIDSEDYKCAIEYFVKAIEIDPNCEEARNNIEIAKQKLKENN